MPTSKPPRVSDILNAIEEFAPSSLAEPWDNVGLLIGNPDADVQKALVSLDVTSRVIDQAKRSRANLIVSHHPLIFHPFKRLLSTDPIQALALRLAIDGMAAIAAHTNLDNAPGGLNDRLAEMLDLHETRPLQSKSETGSSPREYKVVTFVPAADWKKVRDAMAEAGAGEVGNYSHCSFRMRGTGTFKPLRGASPTIGEVGQHEEVEEFRLETLVPRAKLSHVLNAMRRAHPYEEVAFDVYPLASPQNEMSSAGTGRIGILPRSMTLSEFASLIEKKLKPEHLRIVGRNRRVRRVAVCTGAGAGLIDDAAKSGAAVYVTGDVKHHEALRAEELGLAIVDPGHATSEQHAVELLAEIVTSRFPSLKIIRSITTEPFSALPPVPRRNRGRL